jgi:hypothetical protein
MKGRSTTMDPFSHLAHQRLQDLHATADAIRLERTATEAHSTQDPDPRAATDAVASVQPSPVLGPVLEVVGDRYSECDPEPRAA